MPLKTIQSECRARMDKSVEHFHKELRGIRTGRATPALIEYVKVEYYGNPTDLRELAAMSAPEPTIIMVKPFDPAAKNEIVKAIESADLGLNPQVDGNTIRISIPAPSKERRKQLVNQVRKMAEEARVAIRNERRDAMKQIDTLIKDKENPVSEDDGKNAKSDIDELTKKHIKTVDDQSDKKATEVESV